MNLDARLKYFTTSDKIKLYYELWVPDVPKAIIIFVHGLGDHTGRHSEFAKYLIRNGYGICLYDQRGHGKSSGRRAHCKSFNDYLCDLSQIADMAHEHCPNVPMFLIGHSFGGQVAINFIARYSKGIRGVILLSPNIEPLIKIPPWKKKAVARLSKFLPIVKFHSRIEPAYFSHDEKVIREAEIDPLMNWHVTARLGAEILKNLGQLPKLAFQVKIPCLLLQGGADKICSVEATRKFYHSILIQNKDFRVFPELYHELLNETERGKVFKTIGEWLEKQLAVFKHLAKAGEGGDYESKKLINLWHSGAGYSHIG